MTIQLSNDTEYAGFWLRFAAFIIDNIIMTMIMIPVMILITYSFPNFYSDFTAIKLKNKIELIDSNVKKSEEENLFIETNTYKAYFRDDSEVLLKKIIKKDINKDIIISEKDVFIDPETGHEIEEFNDGLFIIIILILLYYPVMESSKYMSTLGKMLLRLKVVNKDGNRLTFADALIRSLLKSISLIFFIGFFITGWNKKKQAIHDFAMRTYVVVDNDK